ncbi:MAG: hypothetical protein AAF800_05120 [Planctomycetota bacterium]
MSTLPPTQPDLGRLASRLGRHGDDPIRTTDAAAPALRLVGDTGNATAAAPSDHTLSGIGDPRWVLAVRTAEQLEGSVLTPEKRDSLLRLGQGFGLGVFDANLVIAIVQDQARRGYAPAHCPAAAEPQLRLVPPPRPQRWMTGPRTLLIAGIIAGFVALELVVLAWVF